MAHQDDAPASPFVKRTRRWEFVKQDVVRLAALGQSDSEIATALGLDRSTVFRWRQSGKLGRPRRRESLALPFEDVSPAEWAKAVRESYDLDATDGQFVLMAESVLTIARDVAQPVAIRLNAMGRFQSLVKQLKVIARAGADDEGDAPEAPKRQTFQVPRRSGEDPRAVLTAVK